MMRNSSKQDGATYAERLRAAMSSTSNGAGRPLAIRDLALAVGRSYEQCRLVLQGEPVASKEFNDAACRFLRLDAEEMWKLATVEKARRRLGLSASDILVPPDRRLLKAWDKLTQAQREHVVNFAEQLAAHQAKGKSKGGGEVYTVIMA